LVAVENRAHRERWRPRLKPIGPTEVVLFFAEIPPGSRVELASVLGDGGYTG
jgi:hypothetical protein